MPPFPACAPTARLRDAHSRAAGWVTACAHKLRITSKPPGATVELDGAPVRTTPFEKDFPGGYFHRTKTVVGSRLEHPMIARITLAGYATKEILLSQGPMSWIALNGRHHGDYWLLKTDKSTTLT